LAKIFYFSSFSNPGQKKNSTNFFFASKAKIFSALFLHRLRLDWSKKREKENTKKRKKILERREEKKTWYQFFLCFKNKLSNMSKIALLTVRLFCKFQRKKRFCQLERCALKFNIVLYKMIMNTSAFNSKN
jgi:hypothetical protein